MLFIAFGVASKENSSASINWNFSRMSYLALLKDTHKITAQQPGTRATMYHDMALGPYPSGTTYQVAWLETLLS